MKKFSKKLERLMDFITFTHEFREVFRSIQIRTQHRSENDSEHSYQLAMVAWFLIEQDKLKLDKELCFMYALSHDLVEIYAGDTYFLDKNLGISKHNREKEAIKQISKRFPNFKSLVSILEKYEKKNDKESRFISALDKLIPPIQVYMEKGKLWHERGVNFSHWLENKNEKISLSKNVSKYWQELLAEISKNKKKLFPSI